MFDQLEGSSEDERKLLTAQRDKLEAERRILNRALFTLITIDDEENATYTPDKTTASIIAHTNIDASAQVTAETKLPHHQAGQVSIFSTYVELRGIEPLTFSMRTRRATNCAIAPDRCSDSEPISRLTFRSSVVNTNSPALGREIRPDPPGLRS